MLTIYLYIKLLIIKCQVLWQYGSADPMVGNKEDKYILIDLGQSEYRGAERWVRLIEVSSTFTALISSYSPRQLVDLQTFRRITPKFLETDAPA